MKKVLTYVSGAVTAVICAVMNFYLIPNIQENAGGMKIFDMHFNYSYDDAMKFLSSISKEGKALYLHVQLPLDFVYPIAYCMFFCLLLFTLSKGKKLLLTLPIALAVIDYAENILSIIMLTTNSPSAYVVYFASAVTSTKTILMYIVFALIIAYIIYYFFTRTYSEI